MGERWGLLLAGGLLVGAGACGARPPTLGMEPCRGACARTYPALTGSAPVGRTPSGQRVCACWYTEVNTTLAPRGE
jgi:hypothetical protein